MSATLKGKSFSEIVKKEKKKMLEEYAAPLKKGRVFIFVPFLFQHLSNQSNKVAYESVLYCKSQKIIKK